MKTIREFLKDRPKGLIYHYTNATATIGILQGNLWSSGIRQLNDSSEFFKARELIRDELNRLDGSGVAAALQRASGNQEIASQIEREPLGKVIFSSFEHGTAPPLFISSFSEREDLLSQWRAYCSEGNGYALGFDASNFESDTESGTRLVHCEYGAEEAKQLCSALIESWDENDAEDSPARTVELYKDCMTIMAAVKDPSFKEEHEWRLVSVFGDYPPRYRQGRHGIVPYLEIPHGGEHELKLKTIWIGPNSDQEAAESALKGLIGKSKISIRRSDIPYRH